MSHQSVSLGVPAFQLEFPYSVRQHLMKTPDLVLDFADSMGKLFQGTVLPIEKRHHRVPMPLPSAAAEKDNKGNPSEGSSSMKSKGTMTGKGAVKAFGHASREIDDGTMRTVANTIEGFGRVVDEMLNDISYFGGFDDSGGFGVHLR